MVDVVVDAKPLAKLPADPSTVPDSVKKRADAVAAFYDKDGKRPHDVEANPEQPTVIQVSEPIPAPPPPMASQLEAPTPPRAPPAAPPAHPVSAAQAPQTAQPPSADQEDDSPEGWKRRFLRMQGQYTASQKTIGEMQEQMTQLGQELLRTQRYSAPPVPEQPPPPSAPVTYLTEQDVQTYGTELIDLTQRAAVQALAPQLQQIQEDNARLRQRLAQEARRNLDQRVAVLVPNYREIDRNPRWHQWLLGVDILAGRVRQTLLNEAISAADAPRVSSFFKGFLNEEAATGHSAPAPSSFQAAAPKEPALNLASLAAPGRARPANGGDPNLPTEKPIYTRAQISQLYNMERRGAYMGREAEWARQEADIFAAQREGRVRN
jgi:hypothetical protein